MLRAGAERSMDGETEFIAQDTCNVDARVPNYVSNDARDGNPTAACGEAPLKEFR